MARSDNAVGWFEIYVEDIDRATAFYEAVFQCALTRQKMGESGPDMALFPNKQGGSGAAGALIQMPQMRRPSTDGALVYFSCDDCAEERSRAEAAGGACWGEKFAIPGRGHIAIIIDSEGNQIGLVSDQ